MVEAIRGFYEAVYITTICFRCVTHLYVRYTIQHYVSFLFRM